MESDLTMTKNAVCGFRKIFAICARSFARVRSSVVAAFARLAESTGQSPIPSDSAASESVNLQLPVETADSQSDNASPPFRLVELCETASCPILNAMCCWFAQGRAESGIYAQLAKSNHGLAACSLAVLWVYLPTLIWKRFCPKESCAGPSFCALCRGQR